MDSDLPSENSDDLRIKRLQDEIVRLKTELERTKAVQTPIRGVFGGTKQKSEQLISLRSLSLDHYLRVKWQLGHGLPDVSKVSAQEILEQLMNEGRRKEGKLRLYGLMNNAFPWEVIIPIREIAENDGVFIGRDENLCSIVLPDTGISRRHAQITLEEGNLYITDTGSTNGVRVNDLPLTGGMMHSPIVDGDTIALGDTLLRVELLKS